MAFINFALNSRTLLPSDYILDCMLYCMLYAFFSSLWSSPYIPWQLLNFFWERVFGAGGRSWTCNHTFVCCSGVFYSQITGKKCEQQEHLRDVRKNCTHYNKGQLNFPSLPQVAHKIHFLSKGLFLPNHPQWLAPGSACDASPWRLEMMRLLLRPMEVRMSSA